MCSILLSKKSLRLFIRRIYLKANIDREQARSFKETLVQERISKKMWTLILFIPIVYYIFVLVADPWAPNVPIVVSKSVFNDSPTRGAPLWLLRKRAIKRTRTTTRVTAATAAHRQPVDPYLKRESLQIARIRRRRLEVEQKNLFTPVFANLKEATSTSTTPYTSPTTDTNTLLLPVCFVNQNFTVKLILNVTDFLTSSNASIDDIYPMIQRGGYYRPPDCLSRHKVAVVVPYYRNRTENLFTFLVNIHPFLMAQRLEYQIFVIEAQENTKKDFNKGRLYNAGFKEMQKFGEWRCVVFHDVDLLPLSARVLYTCPTYPRHMSSAIVNSNETLFNGTYAYVSPFGGVTAMTLAHYMRVNGHSNLYWGWGEDYDMYWRLLVAELPNVRYNKAIAKYYRLPHTAPSINLDKFAVLVFTARERAQNEGLNTVEYNVVSIQMKHLYTRMVVDIDPVYT